MERSMKTTVFLSLLLLSLGVHAVPSTNDLNEMFKADYNGAHEDNERLMRLKYKAARLQNASTGTGRCYMNTMERCDAEARRGDVIASSTAVRAAQIAGTCAMMDIKDFGKTNYQEYALQAGIALAQAWLHNDGGMTSAPSERAIGYLEYASSEGRTEGNELLAKLREKKNPTARMNTAKADFSMTAEQAVADFDGNNMLFKKTYARKVLRITGTATDISENGNIVTIRLDGAPKKDPDLKRLQDEIECRISDNASKEKAFSVRKGKKVVVQGMYVIDNSL